MILAWSCSHTYRVLAICLLVTPHHQVQPSCMMLDQSFFRTRLHASPIASPIVGKCFVRMPHPCSRVVMTISLSFCFSGSHSKTRSSVIMTQKYLPIASDSEELSSNKSSRCSMFLKVVPCCSCVGLVAGAGVSAEEGLRLWSAEAKPPFSLFGGDAVPWRKESALARLAGPGDFAVSCSLIMKPFVSFCISFSFSFSSPCSFNWLPPC
mmetsp:Transcript_40668/g.98945  ORF Transcript_40668/g.98945 Transcript_40668/m.98945 type:complete len:209 (-) Transcript_40668:190-816(-)